MSSIIEDKKKMMLRIAQFKAYISSFVVNKKATELILRGLDLNLTLCDTSSLIEYNNEHLIGNSLLHLAFNEYAINVYNILISKGADYNIKNKEGNTVLHEAYNSICAIYHLSLENFQGYCCNNPFIVPTLSEHVKNKNPSNPSDSNGVTYFHIACATNHIEAVQFFLNNGVPVNEAVEGVGPRKFFEGCTSLHFAVHFGHVEVIEKLLAHGANTNLKDGKGKTPLDICLEKNIELIDSVKKIPLPVVIETNQQILALLLNFCSNFSRLRVAIVMQSLFEIESLSSQKIDINQSLDSKIWPGYSALHFAAHTNVKIVNLLIKNGADIEAKEASGSTPFDMCIERYSVQDILDILCSVPIWKNILLSDAQTKLVDLLFALRNLDAVKNFLEKSTENVKLFVPFDSPLWPGFTVLHLAMLFTDRIKCKTDYQYINNKGTYDPDLSILTECLEHDADVTTTDNRNWTPIHFAFRLGKQNAVRLLLQHHHKMINSADTQNLSHLHVACEINNQDLVKKLLWNEANVNIIYKGNSRISSVYPGWTPLHVAVHEGNCEIVKLLLKFGADVHAIDENGFTPIHVLLNHYSFKEISQALFSTPNLRDCVVQDMGLSYLHVACWTNNIDAVEKLLDSGADINRAIKRDSENYAIMERYNGNTPLHCALDRFSHRLELRRLLIERGADLLIKNSSNLFPFKAILKLEDDKHIDVVVAALRSNAELRKRVEVETGVTMLHLACLNNDVNLVEELLDDGADVNAQINDNSTFWPKNTCLHVLLSKCDDGPTEDDAIIENIVQLLLNHGADVTLSNANKDTPLHVIYRELINTDDNSSYWRQIRLLLKAHENFKVNPKNTNGFSHFHIACHTLNVDIVENFLEHGVDVNAMIDPFSTYKVAACTPLHLATSVKSSTASLTDLFAQLKIVDLLIKHGADLDAEDIDRNTPVHNVVSYNSSQENLLQLLANNGANMNARNIHGETPLELLIEKRNFTLAQVRYFLALGCRFNSFNTVTDRGYIAITDSVLSHEDMQLLLFGVFVNSPDLIKMDDMNRTAIHNIVSLNFSETSDIQYVDLFDIFMKFGCDIDDQDNLGRTALHLAALFRHESAVEGLLLAGADVNATDHNGKTPFAYVFEPCSLCNKAGIKEHNQYSHLELFKIFIRQIKKMEYCDIYVNQSNSNLLNEALERFDSEDIANNLEDILPEIVQVMNLKIEPYSLSVADFVTNDALAVIDYPTMSLAKRKAIDEFFRKNQQMFYEQYQNTAAIFQLQYRQAVLRRKMIDVAKGSLSVLMRLRLPDICSHIILGLLKNYELQNLISATIL